CCDGGSAASRHRNLTRSPAAHWPAHAPGRFRGLPLSWKPLGVGVGNRMDLGVAGPAARSTGGRGGARRSKVGYRRAAGTATPFISVVVISDSRASVGHHSYP